MLKGMGARVGGPVALFLALLAGSSGARAATAPGVAPTRSDSAGAPVKGAKPADDDDFPVPADEPVVLRQFAPAEVRHLCEKYAGALIAYYGEVYKVEGCKRRALLDSKTVYDLQRQGHRVIEVESEVIAAIPEGEALDETTAPSRARDCKQLEGRYVTYSNVDVYVVEHCTRRVFPDWTTYIQHREKRGDKKGEILALTWYELNQLPPGAPIPSVVDDMFAKLLKIGANVDVIPINEACAGVEGRFVTYYSRVYKVDQCRKHELVDSDLHMKRLGLDKIKMKELNSEQWLSLPDGAAVVVPPGPKAQPSPLVRKAR